MAKLRLMKRRRPAAISITFVDPWSGEFCSGATVAYTPERAARGYYSRTIKRLRTVAKDWTATRTPQLKVEFIWSRHAN